MTTEDGAPASDGAGEATPGGRDVTTFPDLATVLVRSTGPPTLPTDRCVDVRPGPFATFDGDRFQMALAVTDGDHRRRFDYSELPAVEDAVVSALGGSPPPAAADRGADAAGGNERAVLRFGDRAACRRMLPTPTVAAIERRLGAAARRAYASLVTWTTGDPRPDDGRFYDVVLDAPRGRPE